MVLVALVALAGLFVLVGLVLCGVVAALCCCVVVLCLLVVGLRCCVLLFC